MSYWLFLFQQNGILIGILIFNTVNSLNKVNLNKISQIKTKLPESGKTKLKCCGQPIIFHFLVYDE